MTGLDFANVPLPATDFGRALYDEGRAVVARSGRGLDAVIWDADEVLWDWALSGTRLLGNMVRAVGGDLTHREWFMVRPGIMELLWGMRHEALARGLDPDMRIWTSGYAWRLWAIGRQVPGFGELLGLGPSWGSPGTDEASLAAVRASPRIMARMDFSDAMRTLFRRATREPFLRSIDTRVRAVIERQLATRPAHPGFKIPELAAIVGKTGFGTARVLVDDTRLNVSWFAATGRGAVHVGHFRPTIGWGNVPNAVWFEPLPVLARATSDVTYAIAKCLRRLGGAPDGGAATGLLRADATRKTVPRAVPSLYIDVPGPVLWREWIAPGRELERDARRLLRAELSLVSD